MTCYFYSNNSDLNAFKIINACMHLKNGIAYAFVFDTGKNEKEYSAFLIKAFL